MSKRGESIIGKRGFYVGDLVVQRENHFVWGQGVRLGVGRVCGLESTRGPKILVIWHIENERSTSWKSVWEYVHEIKRVSPLEALAMQI